MYSDLDVSHLNVWVSTALSRNLRELHLSDIIWSPPREIFTCTTLVVLRLGGTLGSLVLNVPTLVHLQSLKILVINSLRFLDDGSVYRLFSSCPLLEDLSIEECDCRNISVFNIFAPPLKSLTINCRTWFDNSGMPDGPVDSVEYDSDDLGDPNYMYKFVLNTPNLQELKYKEVATEIYSVNKLNACVKVDISFFQRDSRVHDGSMEKLAIAEFVERICRVQWLYLSDNLMQFYRFPLPKFDHLTYLELGHHRTVQWKMLLDFVQSSPQLETLVFGGLAKERNQTTSRWYQLEHVPSCLLFHLKIIEIKQFSADSRELKMAKYFLNNSRVLEKLIIHPDCVSEELEICKKILMLPRRSRTCRVEVLPEMEEEEEEEEEVEDEDEDEDIFAVTP